MVTITRNDGYELSTDPKRLDVERVHHWLSTDAYWALGRSRESTLRAITSSMVFGVYRPTDQAQVAFGRAVTDETTIAWLCDVYVDLTERGRGLGSWLAATARDELTARGVRRIMLATVDAHEVYARLGFTPLARPDQLMELDLRG
ncbi:GNAT family N-acetyltransferase [Micromonospora sp. NPDC003197]